MDHTPTPDNEVPAYQLSHTAPVDDGYSKPISQLTQMFGSDVYDHPDFYGTADAETMAQLHKAREDPDAELTIYRAVPPEHQEINTGDWVTLSRKYAQEHSYDLTSGGDGVIISATVPAAEVFTDGNDLAEYGYAGKRLNLAAGDGMDRQAAEATRNEQLQKAREAQKFAQSQQLHPIGHAAAGQGKSINQVKTTPAQQTKTQGQLRSR